MKYKTITKGKKPFSGRVYDIDGEKYMSVTSIINPEGIAFPEHLLIQYQARGTIVHEQTEHFLRHYQFVDPKYICDQELIDTVVNGSLNISWEDCNPLGFFARHGHKIQIKQIEKRVINKEHKYAGRLDCSGYFEDVPATFDFKTASNYTTNKMINYWKQQAAYAKCKDFFDEPPEAMVIIPFNPKSEQGFEEPIVETDIDHYFELFLQDVAYARENYNIV